MLAGLLDQRALGSGDCAIGGFARHRRLRQKLGPEVLDGDLIEISHHGFGPFAAGIGALGSDVGVLFGRARFAVLYPRDATDPLAGLRRAIIR